MLKVLAAGNFIFMKKATYYLGITALLLALPLVSLASEFRVGDQPTVKTEEKIVNNLYMAGGSVKSSGTVEGDLIAAGGNLIITGNIGGDILAAGGDINILSNAGGDIRAGGGNISIMGKVGGDVVLGGGQINIDGPGVSGDVAIGGGNIRIDAPVSGGLRIAGGNVYINAPVAGNVVIEAEKVTLGSSAVINGNLKYKSKNEIIKEEGALVQGEVKFEPQANSLSDVSFAKLASAWAVGKFFVLLVSALVIGLVFRRYSKEAVDKAIKNPLLEFGRGIVTVILLPVLSVFLLITVVGIPFGIIGLISLAALMIFSWIIAPILIGGIVSRYILKNEVEVSWKTILLGALLFEVFGLVPFLGWLVQTLFIFIALGVIVAVKWQVAREWR